MIEMAEVWCSNDEYPAQAVVEGIPLCGRCLLEDSMRAAAERIWPEIERKRLDRTPVGPHSPASGMSPEPATPEESEMTVKTENAKITAAMKGRAKTAREKARSEPAKGTMAVSGTPEIQDSLDIIEAMTGLPQEEIVKQAESESPDLAVDGQVVASAPAATVTPLPEDALRSARQAARAEWQRAQWAVNRATEAEQKLIAKRDADPKAVKAADLAKAKALLATRTKVEKDLRAKYEEAQAREKAAK